MVLIASTDPFSAEHTGKALKAVFGWMQPDSFDLLHFTVRKLSHVSEYAILALLWFRAWRGANVGWSMKWARWAFAICLAVAATDEFHQGFVPSRGSTPRDVALDACGALVALLIFSWVI